MRSLLCVLLLLAVVGCTTRSSGPATPEQAALAAAANTDIASYHLRNGALESALAKIRQALQQNPESVDAHLVAAELWSRLDDPDRAEGHYRQALSVDERTGAALNNYAAFLCRQDRVSAALEHWDEAASDPLYNRRAMALSNAARCITDRNPPSADVTAEQYWRRALSLVPDYPLALGGMVEWSLAEGRVDAADEWYSRYTAAAEESAWGLWLGIRVARAGDHAERQGRLIERLRERFPASEQAARLTE
ncbi:type IV pilus biogenesis/stability protein PilW [Spiribacter vilamensis]|uniref:Type IV pilus assembly protein PilF n=1 Tax=Spiribacter vilamensis TaxID=531306 RepID=A0A4Q8D0T5_9GAMM|nr:type IV pilus biogenesis/stability protein PilW [Spiribacter vilamensis]RZU98894.1 type IV pilus assembly protein PilF [Spiribacter vilamensis]TVO62092.1 type IV pilus biogenesis/stability protein PilW [Spiribacter vilamensis]